jgi:ribosomal protein L40E
MDELDELEERARTETVCRGCGAEKETGLSVCWLCFKHREDIVPFKYFDGTFSQWLLTP